MTGIQLYQWLRKSGSGVGKLAHAEAALRKDQGLSAEELIDALRKADLDKKGQVTGYLQGTIAKAERIVELGEWDAAKMHREAAPADELAALLRQEPQKEAPTVQVVKVVPPGPVRDRHRDGSRQPDKPDASRSAAQQ